MYSVNDTDVCFEKNTNDKLNPVAKTLIIKKFIIQNDRLNLTYLVNMQDSYVYKI